MSRGRAAKRRVLCALVLLAAGCSSSPDELTPAEWLNRNTPLLENLRSYEEDKRHRAIRQFQELGRERGTSIALALLHDPALEDYRIEVVLARILADWQDRRAIPFLVAALRSQDAGAKRIAKEGLAVFHDDPQLIEVLRERIVNGTVADRRDAADILSRIATDRAIGIFGERYRDEPDVEVRAYFLLGIKESRHPQRTRFLIDALTDPDEALRNIAWNALRRTETLPRELTFDPRGSEFDRAAAIADLRLWLENERETARRDRPR